MRVRLVGTLNAFGYFGCATASAYGAAFCVWNAQIGAMQDDIPLCKAWTRLVSKLHLAFALLTKGRRVCCSRFDHPK
jgi:hypothetical protein